MSSRRALDWSEAYLADADGWRDNVTVMSDALRAMGEDGDAFDWVRDRLGYGCRYALAIPLS